jgi:hypothetical protein
VGKVFLKNILRKSQAYFMTSESPKTKTTQIICCNDYILTNGLLLNINMATEYEFTSTGDLLV